MREAIQPRLNATAARVRPLTGCISQQGLSYRRRACHLTYGGDSERKKQKNATLYSFLHKFQSKDFH